MSDVLRQLISNKAKNNGLICKENFDIPPYVLEEWKRWSTAVENLLLVWARKHVQNVSPEQWANWVLDAGDAPAKVYYTLDGDVGIEDESWNAFFKNDVQALKSVKNHLVRWLEPWHQGIEIVLRDAAFECASSS